MEEQKPITDLELVDEFINKCREFINPKLLGEVTARGLYNVINFLPRNIDEAKAVARARMAKMNKYFGDEEIDKIAGQIQRLESLKSSLMNTSMTNAHEVKPILDEMQHFTNEILDYYKSNKTYK